MCHEYFRFGWRDEDLQFKDIPYHEEDKRIEDVLSPEDQMQKDLVLGMTTVYTHYLEDEITRLTRTMEAEAHQLEEFEFQLARHWAKQVQGVWLW